MYFEFPASVRPRLKESDGPTVSGRQPLRIPATRRGDRSGCAGNVSSSDWVCRDCALACLEGDAVHFDMLTFWEDIDAIKRFAGDDFQLAKYYDFDRSFLIELEPYVRHYTVYED